MLRAVRACRKNRCFIISNYYFYKEMCYCSADPKFMAYRQFLNVN